MSTATKVAIKPLEDRILVQANEAETTTASGLVIPDTAKEKPQEGTVIAVGPGRIDDKGNRVFLFVGTVGSGADVALTVVPEGHVSLNWRRGSLVFALIGPKDSDQLLDVMAATSGTLSHQPGGGVTTSPVLYGMAPVTSAATARPTSAGVPQRRIGVRPSAIRGVYWSRTPAVMSVSIIPGRTS